MRASRSLGSVVIRGWSASDCQVWPAKGHHGDGRRPLLQEDAVPHPHRWSRCAREHEPGICGAAGEGSVGFAKVGLRRQDRVGRRPHVCHYGSQQCMIVFYPQPLLDKDPRLNLVRCLIYVTFKLSCFHRHCLHRYVNDQRRKKICLWSELHGGASSDCALLTTIKMMTRSEEEAERGLQSADIRKQT